MSASSSRSLPAWLFSNAANTAAKANEGTVPKRSKPATVKMGKKEDKGRLAKQAKKSSRVASPAKKEAAAAQPPRQLLDMVEMFLADNSFGKAHGAFKKQRVKRGLGSSLGTGNGQSLVDLYRFWEASRRTTGKAPAESSSSESSSESESSSSSSSSDSGSEGESEHEAQKAKPPPATLKRKAPASSSSSSSDCSSSDSDSSSGSGSKPQIKKQRTAAASESDCGSGSDSDSSSDGGKMDVDGTSSSSDSEDSSSESDSDPDSSSEGESDSKDAVKAEDVAKVPLPESGSSSESDCSSSDDSDSDSADIKLNSGPGPKSFQAAAVKEWSDSSVTLDNRSPERKVATTNPPLPPDPVTGVSKGHKKQQNERFSRIPKNIQVDSKFASNEYVSMNYSRQAYQDLVVTKGKGFTKEKNKKKRGGFRGGMIDIHEKKGVYFDN